MIRLHLLPVLLARGLEKPFSWLRKNGFTHNMAHGLLKQPTVLSLKHLTKLCVALHCTPNDLLNYTPEGENALPPQHPLNKLIRKEVPPNLPQQLRTLPQEHLDKVWELIQHLKGEDEANAAP